MRRAGNHCATPTEVQNALPALVRGLPEKKAFAVEVRLAVAEATCAGPSGLAETGRRLEHTALARARTLVTPSAPVADGHGRTED
ncbi:hypothetical protein [Streptomyces sp. NPDC048442]|uniref:hypothetical protein n=1 Tax=Streptomyces sp. NPDC048442 TaxID=3154823 RepID=UPI00343F7DBE